MTEPISPRSTVTRPVRIALIGCGAVSRESLLPVLAGHEDVRLTTLVDRDEKRARDLASAYGVAGVLTDAAAITREHADAVVIATPAAHHAPATVAFAEKGLHVFVEKPMAIAAADARRMVDAADRAGVALSVGLYRRFLPSVQLLKDLLTRQEFGRPLAVDAEEGGPYGWQLATLDGLTRQNGGGGVLIDIGSHVIDVVLFVLGATATLVRHRDNMKGGIETDSLLEASLATPTGAVPLRLELSRTRELRGSIQIRCEHATIELERGNFTSLRVLRPGAEPAARSVTFTASYQGIGDFLGYEAFRREFDDWIDAVTSGGTPVLSGRSVVPVVELIEDAYARREDLVEPSGNRLLSPRSASSSKRPRVLVTGAGGFLGGRVVEVLRDFHGYDPVALVREPKGAARLARWPAEIVLGDIVSPADMARVMRGCDAVVHCAVGTSWKADETRKVTVDGTRIAAEAALAAGVKTFVHISSFFVHRRDGADAIDESTALEPPATDSYGHNKLAAERALEAVAARGLRTIVLRPTRIYGPFSRTFTDRPLAALSEGRLAIGGPADVPANMVYIDTVVDAIASALGSSAPPSGSAFIVTDADQLTLREFFDYFGASIDRTVRLLPAWRPESAPPARGFVGRWTSGVSSVARSPEFRGIVRRVIETDPIGNWPRKWWNQSPERQQKMLRRFGADAAVIYRRTAGDGGDDLIYNGEPGRATSAKASRELGFQASVDRATAMAFTLEWATYARLLKART